ncbi:hypothetical protein F5878DRAFT_729692, partial [Lentinula raphanica]
VDAKSRGNHLFFLSPSSIFIAALSSFVAPFNLSHSTGSETNARVFPGLPAPRTALSSSNSSSSLRLLPRLFVASTRI